MFAGVSLEWVEARQLMVPFLAIALCVIVTTLITSRLSLPDLQETRAGDNEKLERSIWSFRHLKLGVIAIFFYVGAEVCVGVNINLHAMELMKEDGALTFFGMNRLIIGGLDLGIPALLATLYWGGMMIGRAISGLFNHISPRTQLIFTTVAATLLALIGIITNNLWVLVSIGLCHSVMWSCIFTLAIKGLKKYTSKASGVFMMGVFGGAIFPLFQGMLADVYGSWQWTWLLVVGCELEMLYYALYGSKVTDPECEE